MFNRMTPPRIAVQKGTLTWYSRSDPGSGPSCAAPPRPPNMPEKMSLKPPLPVLLDFRLRPAAFEQVGEIEAAEIKICALTARALGCPPGNPPESGRRPSGAAARAGIGIGRRGIDVVRVKPKLVVNLPLLGIAQNIVGLGERLELLLRALVAGIDVGMVLARKFAERFANVLGRGGLLYAKGGVVVFGLCCHRLRT